MGNEQSGVFQRHIQRIAALPPDIQVVIASFSGLESIECYVHAGLFNVNSHIRRILNDRTKSMFWEKWKPLTVQHLFEEDKFLRNMPIKYISTYSSNDPKYFLEQERNGILVLTNSSAKDAIYMIPILAREAKTPTVVVKAWLKCNLPRSADNFSSCTIIDCSGRFWKVKGVTPQSLISELNQSRVYPKYERPSNLKKNGFSIQLDLQVIAY